MRLSDIFIGTGRPAEAEQALRSVLAIVEKPAAKDFDEIVLLKIQLSQFLFEQGRQRDAEELALSAQSDATEHLPRESSTAAAAVSNFDKIVSPRKEEGTKANLR